VGYVGKDVGRNRQHQLDTDPLHHQQLQGVPVHSSDSGDLVPVRLLPSHQLSHQHQVLKRTHGQGLFSKSHAGICSLHVTLTFHHVTVEVLRAEMQVLYLEQPDLPHQPSRQGHQHVGAGVVHRLQSHHQNQHLEAQPLGCEQIYATIIHPSVAYLRIPTNIMCSTTVDIMMNSFSRKLIENQKD
jgi:hypothetical protein